MYDVEIKSVWIKFQFSLRCNMGEEDPSKQRAGRHFTTVMSNELILHILMIISVHFIVSYQNPFILDF